MKLNVRKSLLGVFLSAAMLGTLLTGCGNNAQEENENKSPESQESQGSQEKGEDKVIKIAGTGSVSQIFYEAFKETYEAQGYKTEFIAFDSNPVCLEACASGEADISLGQQKKFVQSYNENNGADLEMVKPYGMFTGIGLYSEKYESIDDIPDGSQIAVMNDATNEDVSLKILESAGLIKLADDVEFVTAADITENPKNLEIIEMEQAQTVTALEDMAAACCWFTHMSASGKDPSSFLKRDEVMINYPMGVIANSKDASSDWAIDMAECLRDSEVQKKIDEAFPNVFEFYTSDDQVEE